MTKTEMVDVALSKGLIKNKTAGVKMPIDDLRKLLEEASPMTGEEVSAPTSIEAKAELPTETIPGTVEAPGPTDSELEAIESERPPTLSPTERLVSLKEKLEALEKGAPFSSRPRRKLERGIRKLERTIQKMSASA